MHTDRISNSAILCSNYILLLSALWTCIQVKKMVLEMKPYFFSDRFEPPRETSSCEKLILHVHTIPTFRVYWLYHSIPNKFLWNSLCPCVLGCSLSCSRILQLKIAREQFQSMYHNILVMLFVTRVHARALAVMKCKGEWQHETEVLLRGIFASNFRDAGISVM